MELICPKCGQPNEKEQFASVYKCNFCQSISDATEWWSATAQLKKETKKKGLQIPAKLRFTQYGAVELRLFIPQNYLRVALGFEKLPKELLKKSKPKEPVS